ncbi:cysteine-rich CWC family protein [Paludibacterium paludis]|uniref:DUF1289 domain-containing protein n=1 Tax=Paludibacterium paludis TaxID=1225769 RepID=A0A918UAL8_9NEIS|nr:cysteine-rich CWC family protein [Paludibacterium paludis]GGY17595.1 DUF1289 domain-containing protein [Paludibacterium paludis]
MNDNDAGEIPSPCRQTCRLDPSGKTCEGCGRTIDEIARWSAMNAGERLAVRRRLGLPDTAWPAAATVACPRCGAPFTCGGHGTQACWCASLPPRPLDSAATGCLCPDCLKG